MDKIRGIGVGAGKASGLMRFPFETKEKIGGVFKFLGVEYEKQRLKQGILKLNERLDELYERAREGAGEKEAEIFKLHKMLLNDDDLLEIIDDEIEKGSSVINAIKIASEKYVAILKSIDDEYLSSRATDIKDIEGQLIKIISGESFEKSDNWDAPYILVARDLTPSQTASLDKSLILAIVTMGGSQTSHTSILAKAMGIPAIVGVGEIDTKLDGEIALVDAESATVTVKPTGEEILEFEKKKREYDRVKREHDEYLREIKNRPAMTKNGHRVHIYANIGGEYEVDNALEQGAEGIGLLRSELLYLTLDKLPSENDLYLAYRSVVLKMGGRRVIIRTLDIGADKQIPYMNLEREENPALGLRGVRLCLERREMFKTQIRAILRASAHGDVAIMFPMIISEKEISSCKEIIEECKHQLFEENACFNSKIEIGIMIETPASAIISDKLAKMVDFFSVGTNDLTQYTLAADRQNPKVAGLLEENLDPVFDLIEKCAKEIHKNGGWIGVCGELGADLSYTERFVNMKIDELSVSPPYILGIKKKICSLE